MLKKMMLLALAVGALVVFAVPTVAQAVVKLEDSQGTLNNGAEITMTSTDTKITISPTAVMWCTHTEFVGEVVGFGTTIFAFFGKFESNGCHVNGVVPLTITSSEGEAEFSEGGGGEASLEFMYDVPGLGFSKCIDEASGIGLSWESETNEVAFSGGPLLGTGSGCPAGAEAIHGQFTIATTDGDPVFFE